MREDAGILPAASWRIPAEVVGGARAQLRRKPVGHAGEEGDAHGVEDQAEGSVSHGGGPELIGEAEGGPEVEVVLVLLEAVAAVFGKDQRPRRMLHIVELGLVTVGSKLAQLPFFSWKRVL